VNAEPIYKWKDGHGRTHYGNAGAPRGAQPVEDRVSTIETRLDYLRAWVWLQEAEAARRLRPPEPPAPEPEEPVDEVETKS